MSRQVLTGIGNKFVHRCKMLHQAHQSTTLLLFYASSRTPLKVRLVFSHFFIRLDGGCIATRGKVVVSVARRFHPSTLTSVNSAGNWFLITYPKHSGSATQPIAALPSSTSKRCESPPQYGHTLKIGIALTPHSVQPVGNVRTV